MGKFTAAQAAQKYLMSRLGNNKLFTAAQAAQKTNPETRCQASQFTAAQAAQKYKKWSGDKYNKFTAAQAAQKNNRGLTQAVEIMVNKILKIIISIGYDFILA